MQPICGGLDFDTSKRQLAKVFGNPGSVGEQRTIYELFG